MMSPLLTEKEKVAIVNLYTGHSGDYPSMRDFQSTILAETGHFVPVDELTRILHNAGVKGLIEFRDRRMKFLRRSYLVSSLDELWYVDL